MSDVKIKGISREVVEIEISKKDIIEEAVKLLLKANNLGVGQFLSADGKDIEEDDEWYHGSVTSSKVRTATPKDKKVFEAVKLLQRIK